MTRIMIVGAGMVGLALARQLQRSGIAATLLDERKGPGELSTVELVRDAATLSSPSTARVCALSPGSIRFLQELGVWNRLPGERVSRFAGMTVWDLGGTAKLELPAEGVILENSVIEQALTEGLEVGWGVSVLQVKKNERGFALILSDGSTRQADLLVGADGGKSLIREAVGLRKIHWSYDQQAIVSTVEVEQPHASIAYQVFTSQGPLALLPMPHPRLCSIVWSTTEANARMSLTDQAFCDQLTLTTQGRLGKVLGTSKRHQFGLMQQHAVSYVAQGVVLIGDAAHVIHPLAGQGANLGFADARVLGQVIQGAILEGKDPSAASVLREYQRRCQPKNLLVAGVMEGLKRLFSDEDPRKGWVRNSGMRLINDNDWLKRQLTAVASL